MSSYQQRPQQSPELEPVEPDLDLLEVGKVLLGQASGGNSLMLDLLGLRSAADLSRQRGQVGVARGAGVGLVDGVADGLKGGVGVGRRASWELSPAFGLFSELLWEPAEANVDMAAGFAKGGVDLGADLAQVAVDPLSTLSGLASMNAALPVPINPFRAGRELKQASEGEGTYADALRSLVDPSVSAVEDQAFWGGVGRGVLQPYEEAWSNGKPSEIPGRLLLEVAPDLLGAGLGAKALGVGAKANHLGDAAKVATEVNRFTWTELEALLYGAVGRSNKLLGATPKDPAAVASMTKLQAWEEFALGYVKQRMSEGMSQEEAIEASRGVQAYVRRSSGAPGDSTGIYFRDDIPPELRAEVVQHEVNHLYAGGSFPNELGEAMEEALVQFVTRSQLGRPTTLYPNLMAVMDGALPQVGEAGLVKSLVSGGSGMLGKLIAGRDWGRLADIQQDFIRAHELDLAGHAQHIQKATDG